MAEEYTLPPKDVLKLLDTSERGLSEKEAKKRLEKYGPNEIKKEKRASASLIFINQFKNALLLLLIFAGILSLFLKENLESIAIFGILLLNAVMGFIQEYKAEKAIEALRKMSSPTAKVLREGKQMKIPAAEVVCGDILLLESGDIVPADSRLLEVSSLQIDESSLTGESIPSKKFIHPLEKGTAVTEQENMAFTGTTVTYGKGRGIVTATGMKTEFGKIALSLEATKEVQTPLQKKFAQLAKQIGVVAVALTFIVLILGTLQGISFAKMLLFALALTVSTIPSSLPVIVTVSLSMGAKRLVKKNMLIKKLPAAESLGAATIICSDKTGTITKNQMTITHLFANDGIIEVSGSGYEPKGNFSAGSRLVNPKEIELLLRIGCLCNNAKLGKKERDGDTEYEVIGDPTEGSLIVLGKKGKLDEEYLQSFGFIEELPFDSERKRMSVIFKNKLNKKTEAYVKGAPDLLLKVCDKVIKNGRVSRLTGDERERLIRINNLFAGKALRVLGFAYRDVSDVKNYSIAGIEKDLVFVGIGGMIDPPRENVRRAVEECREAGIKVMIITGDHSLTTKAIAEQIGLLEEKDIVLTGDELEKMSDEELEKSIEDIRIIARALPVQKSRVVNALKKRGHIVAMTGDGVNDAPALKKADIGIAMGITGTDVAKEVSKAILVDDNFATIVNAIEEGRNIYDKMIKSAKYLLSCNTGEIASVFMAVMLGFPLPILPLQLLLMNLLTDEFPALGLGFEEVEQKIMKRPPRKPREKPITKRMLISIIFFGLIMGFGTLCIFIQYKDISLTKARTMAFTTLVMFQMFVVISSRSLLPSLKKLNPFSNLWLFGGVCLSLIIQSAVIYFPPLQAVFGTTSLLAIDWLKIVAVSSIGFIAMELSKLMLAFRRGS